MLKRGTTGRRLCLAVAVAALGAMAYAAIALAASDTIVAGPGEAYSQATYNTDQGAVVPFQNLGGSHNVTARQNGPDGKALFRSPTIDSGSANVDGTQYLQAGDYAFFCTVHPTTMSGTLHVTGNGTALARPAASLTSKTKTISKALKKGIKVSATASTAISGVAFTAKLGKAVIGKATAALAAGTQTVTVKLTKAGKSKLRGKKKASVTVTADIPFGSPATAKAKLK
jgi:plastocyanin/roadblock/LC7 domain-containing protein